MVNLIPIKKEGKMDNWFAIFQYEKARQREIVTEIRNNYLIRSARRERKEVTGRAYQKVLTGLGKYLETLGQALQKKFQTC